MKKGWGVRRPERHQLAKMVVVINPSSPQQARMKSEKVPSGAGKAVTQSRRGCDELATTGESNEELLTS
jgi:hypothetical protein